MKKGGARLGEFERFGRFARWGLQVRSTFDAAAVARVNIRTTLAAVSLC